MASLMANYTDSEEEDDATEEAGGEAKDSTAPSSNADEASNLSAKSASRPGSATSTPPVKKTRLVSYGGGEDDDEFDVTKSDVEDGGEKEGAEKGEEDAASEREDDVVSMDLDSENNGEDNEEEAKEDERGATASALRHSTSTVEVEAWTGGVQLPPEPAGVCQPKLQALIDRLYRKKVETGYDMNSFIQNNKAFRNPSIYEKLIQFCEIDEHGTNLPKELYDGHLFGPESYYDELAKVQAAEMEKREKKVAAAKAAGSGSGGGKPVMLKDGGKRTSKWDQMAPADGAKTISAFGPLKK